MKSEDAFNYIRKALDGGRPAQAYLFTGSVRGECTALAERVLKYLYCAAPEGNRPCGICDACRHVAMRLNVDVHWIFPEKKSRVIGIDQIREKVIKPMSETSYSGGWKACVIAGADCLRKEAANAFLKTLEEPGAQTLFLLLTDSPQHLLPTVISRCQRLDLSESEGLPGEFRDRIEEILSSPHLGTVMDRMIAATLLSGVLQDLKKFAEEQVVAEIDEAENEAGEKESREVSDARVSSRYREYRKAAVVLIYGWFRDLMIMTAGGGEELLLRSSRRAILQERAGKMTLDIAYRNLETVEKMRRQFDLNMPEDGVIGYAMDRLRHGV